MIITMTGKPCSGKSVIIKVLQRKYGFDVFSSGQIYREVAIERGIDVLELNRIADTSVDALVDKRVMEEGIKRQYDEVVFDSRIAWHFLPQSFKTFVDVNETEQAKRLLGSNRQDENTNLSFNEAKQNLLERWNLENERYQMLYGCDNKNPKNYDFVIDTSSLSIEEGADKVYENYCTFKDTTKEKQKQEQIAEIIQKAQKQSQQNLKKENKELGF